MDDARIQDAGDLQLSWAMLDSNWKKPARKRFLELYTPEYDDASRRRQKKSPSPELPYFPSSGPRNKSDWDLSELDLMLEGPVAPSTPVDIQRNRRDVDDIRVMKLLNPEIPDHSESLPRNIPLIPSRNSIQYQDSKDVVAESKRRPEVVGLDTVEQVAQVPDAENDEREILFPEYTLGHIDGLEEEEFPDGDKALNAPISTPETEPTDQVQRSNSSVDDSHLDSQETFTAAPLLQIGSSQLSQSANIMSEHPVQQPSIAPLTTFSTSTAYSPSAQNGVMEISRLTNMENVIESMESGGITAPLPVSISDIVQEVPITTPVPEQHNDNETMSVEASRPETSKVIPELLNIPLTKEFTAINKYPHIPHVAENATLPTEVETSSPNSDEQSTSIVEIDTDILLPPQETTMDINLRNMSQAVDHANSGTNHREVMAIDNIVLDVLSEQVFSEVVDPKIIENSKTFEKGNHDSDPKSSVTNVFLDGDGRDGPVSIEELLSESVEQELSPTSVSSNLTPQFKTNTKQHTPTPATPVEPILDNNLEIPAENTSKISTESLTRSELPGLVAESENRGHEVLPEGTLVFLADVITEESTQVNKEEDVSHATESLLQEENSMKSGKQVDECVAKKQSEAIDPGLDISIKKDDAMQEAVTDNNDAVERILIEEGESMQATAPDNDDSTPEVPTQSVEMAPRDSELNEDHSASEKGHAEPTNESPDESNTPLFESTGLESLDKDAIKEQSSIEGDVTRKSSSKDYTSISPVRRPLRSASLPPWSAPIPAFRSPSVPPNYSSLPISPLSQRAKPPIPSVAPIPPTPSSIPERLSTLRPRYPPPARDSLPASSPSSTRDPSPIRDTSSIKDTSPARASPSIPQARAPTIPYRQTPAVVITIPAPIQEITPLPTESPTTEDAGATGPSVARIKIKFDESAQSSESPPPAKRQKISRSKTKDIFDCIVVRSDFENAPKGVVTEDDLNKHVLVKPGKSGKVSH